MYVLKLTIDGEPELVFRTDSRQGLALLAKLVWEETNWVGFKMLRVDANNQEHPLVISDVLSWNDTAVSGTS